MPKSMKRIIAIVLVSCLLAETSFPTVSGNFC